MFRYYFDSNIYRLLKPSHPGHRADLKEMLAMVKPELLIFYSDGHFDDLKDSLAEYRDIDLAVIGQYADDNYFTVDLKFNLQYYLAYPLTAFSNKDYAAAERYLKNPQRLDELLPPDDDPLLDSLKGWLKTFFDLPLRAFNPEAPNASQLPAEHRDWISRMIPNYSPDMPLCEFWDASLNYSTLTMGDDREMTALRKYVADYVDRDTISWDNWKSRFNQQFKSTALDKTFTEVVENMLLDSQKDNLWLRIGYLYALLEMYGITQERSGKKPKKNSMSDLLKDAQHVYYASFTDFLVTEDKGMQLKAHIIYGLLNFSTEVLTLGEFMARKRTLQEKESVESLTAALGHDIRHGLQLYSVPDLIKGNDTACFKATVPYFGYFNRLLVKDDELTLYCSRKAPRANFIMYKELQVLTRRLLAVFGPDDEQMGEYDLAEQTTVTDMRSWTSKGHRFILSTYVQEGRSFITLTFLFKTSSSAPL